MFKKNAFIFLLVISLSSLSLGKEIPFKELGRHFDQALVSTVQGKKIRTAIGNIIYANSGIGSVFSNYFSSLLSVKIKETKYLQEFSRKDLDRILQEQELSQSDLFDEKSRVKIGKIQGVQALITGEYVLAKDKIIVTLRLLSIKTSQVIKTVVCFLSKQSLPEGMELLPPNYQRLKENELKIPVVGNLTVKSWVSKGEGGVYVKGEKLHIFFQANKDCFVRLFHIDVNGKKQLLFPNEFYPENKKLQGGKVYVFPDENMEFDFEMGAPFGTEEIIAIASTEPFKDKIAAFSALKGKTQQVLSKGINITRKKNEIAQSRVFYTIIEKEF